jgi:hypothetical protein
MAAASVMTLYMWFLSVNTALVEASFADKCACACCLLPPPLVKLSIALVEMPFDSTFLRATPNCRMVVKLLC